MLHVASKLLSSTFNVLMTLSTITAENLESQQVNLIQMACRLVKQCTFQSHTTQAQEALHSWHRLNSGLHSMHTLHRIESSVCQRMSVSSNSPLTPHIAQHVNRIQLYTQSLGQFSSLVCQHAYLYNRATSGCRRPCKDTDFGACKLCYLDMSLLGAHVVPGTVTGR